MSGFVDSGERNDLAGAIQFLKRRGRAWGRVLQDVWPLSVFDRRAGKAKRRCVHVLFTRDELTRTNMSL